MKEYSDMTCEEREQWHIDAAWGRMAMRVQPELQANIRVIVATVYRQGITDGIAMGTGQAIPDHDPEWIDEPGGSE